MALHRCPNQFRFQCCAFGVEQDLHRDVASLSISYLIDNHGASYEGEAPWMVGPENYVGAIIPY